MKPLYLQHNLKICTLTCDYILNIKYWLYDALGVVIRVDTSYYSRTHTEPLYFDYALDIHPPCMLRGVRSNIDQGYYGKGVYDSRNSKLISIKVYPWFCINPTY